MSSVLCSRTRFVFPVRSRSCKEAGRVSGIKISVKSLQLRSTHWKEKRSKERQANENSFLTSRLLSHLWQVLEAPKDAVTPYWHHLFHWAETQFSNTPHKQYGLSPGNTWIWGSCRISGKMLMLLECATRVCSLLQFAMVVGMVLSLLPLRFSSSSCSNLFSLLKQKHQNSLGLPQVSHCLASLPSSDSCAEETLWDDWLEWPNQTPACQLRHSVSKCAARLRFPCFSASAAGPQGISTFLTGWSGSSWNKHKSQVGMWVRACAQPLTRWKCWLSLHGQLYPPL